MAIQPYKSLDQLVRTLHVVLPKPRDDWRLVRDPLVGQINGLPHFIGATYATNGILVLLVSVVGASVFGHLEWFVPDASEAHVELSDLYDLTTIKAPKKVPSLEEYYKW